MMDISFGLGEEGVLGNGKTIDCFSPTVVLWPPLTEDFKQEELNTVGEGDRTAEENSKRVTKTEKGLSSAMEEMKLLQSKLSVMEQYAGILHGSIFREPLEEQHIPISLQNSDTYEIGKEWDRFERMLESGDQVKLLRLEKFYQNMLKLMKRRIQKIVKECLSSSTIN